MWLKLQIQSLKWKKWTLLSLDKVFIETKQIVNQISFATLYIENLNRNTMKVLLKDYSATSITDHGKPIVLSVIKVIKQ